MTSEGKFQKDMIDRILGEEDQKISTKDLGKVLKDVKNKLSKKSWEPKEDIDPAELEAMRKEVLDKVIVARVGLLLRHPFFGNMATRLKIASCDDWCPTAATDGRHLFYSVPFFAKMTNKEVEFVIAHEILHCVYDHMTRREDRDPQIHNIAADYIVNNTLVRLSLIHI